MVRKRLPTGKEVFSEIPTNALTTNVLDTFREGMYAFRLSHGTDIYGFSLYQIEVRNIFGFLDDFCEVWTDSFRTRKEAEEHLKTCQVEASREYERLKQKQKRRIEDGKVQ